MEVKNNYEMIVSVFAKILLYQNFSRILALCNMTNDLG